VRSCSRVRRVPNLGGDLRQRPQSADDHVAV